MSFNGKDVIIAAKTYFEFFSVSGRHVMQCIFSFVVWGCFEKQNILSFKSRSEHSIVQNVRLFSISFVVISNR
jgi:hypothetical protein